MITFVQKSTAHKQGTTTQRHDDPCTPNLALLHLIQQSILGRRPIAMALRILIT